MANAQFCFPIFTWLALTSLGDSVGSSAQREVGGDGDSKTDAQLPSSPSSSGGFRQFSSKDCSL